MIDYNKTWLDSYLRIYFSMVCNNLLRYLWFLYGLGNRYIPYIYAYVERVNKPDENQLFEVSQYPNRNSNISWVIWVKFLNRKTRLPGSMILKRIAFLRYPLEIYKPCKKTFGYN